MTHVTPRGSQIWPAAIGHGCTFLCGGAASLAVVSQVRLASSDPAGLTWFFHE